MSAERFVLQQQRDLGQIVEAAFGFYFQNVRPLVTIAAVIIPLGIANAAFLETINDPGVQGTIFPFISLAQFIVDILVAAALIAALASAALSYSADAVIGRWWRTLGIVIVLWIITVGPASAVSGVLFLGPVFISGTLSTIVRAALLPFGVIAMTLLYLDLKERRETDVSV